MLWYPLSPVAASWFVAIVPSSYLTGVIACFADEHLAPSFRRHLARQAATILIIQALIASSMVKHIV